MSKIRAGVIGAGSWAAVAHLPALRDRDDVEIVAVCRKGDQLLASLKQEFLLIDGLWFFMHSLAPPPHWPDTSR